MLESIRITKPDKFDGKDTSIAVVIAWTFSVKEYMELLIRVDVPHFGIVAKPSRSKTSLLVIGDLCEFYVLLHAEGPSGDDGDRRVFSVEFIAFDDPNRFGGRVGFGLRF